MPRFSILVMERGAQTSVQVTLGAYSAEDAVNTLIQNIRNEWGDPCNHSFRVTDSSGAVSWWECESEEVTRYYAEEVDAPEVER